MKPRRTPPGQKRRHRRRVEKSMRTEKQRKGEHRCPKCKKVTFPNQAAAEFAADRVTTSTQKKVRMRAYKGKCGRWHLSSIRTPEQIRLKYLLRQRRKES